MRAERFGGNEYYERISSHEALEEMEEAEAAERELEEVLELLPWKIKEDEPSGVQAQQAWSMSAVVCHE